MDIVARVCRSGLCDISYAFIFFFFFLLFRPPPRSTLFPYPTLFRSAGHHHHDVEGNLAQGAGDQAEEIQGFGEAIAGYVPGGLRHAQHPRQSPARSEEHTSELQSRLHLVCRLLLEKKNKTTKTKKKKKQTTDLKAT